ncbi:MAG: HNH endonuclease [Chloroflexota bacterium]
MTYIPDRLRQEVIERANHQCEYCLLHELDSIYSHEVDHIIPEKHRGETVSSNLCFACLECNRNKGSDFGSFDPENNEIVLLYNPRKDVWSKHFRLDDAKIIPQTATGRVTEFILKLNTEKRLSHRRLLIKAKRYPSTNE